MNPLQLVTLVRIGSYRSAERSANGRCRRYLAAPINHWGCIFGGRPFLRVYTSIRPNPVGGVIRGVGERFQWRLDAAADERRGSVDGFTYVASKSAVASIAGMLT